MGFEEQDTDEDGVVVVTEQTVIHAATSKGFTVREAQDGISWEISKGRKKAFFPKAFVAGGYTERQLAAVEAAFEDCGVDLFPIGQSLH